MYRLRRNPRGHSSSTIYLLPVTESLCLPGSSDKSRLTDWLVSPRDLPLLDSPVLVLQTHPHAQTFSMGSDLRVN